MISDLKTRRFNGLSFYEHLRRHPFPPRMDAVSVVMWTTRLLHGMERWK